MAVERTEQRHSPTQRDRLREVMGVYRTVIHAAPEAYDGLDLIGTFQEAVDTLSKTEELLPQSTARIVFHMARRGAAVAEQRGDPITARMLREDADTFGIVSGGYPRVGAHVEPITDNSRFETSLYRRPDGTLAEGYRTRIIDPDPITRRALVGFYPLGGRPAPQAAGVRVSMRRRD